MLAALAAAVPGSVQGKKGDDADNRMVGETLLPADDGKAIEATTNMKPLFSFDAGELAVLRKLAVRRKELEAREASLIERERLVAALEAKLADQAGELKKLQAALVEQETRISDVEKKDADGDMERLQELAKAYKAMKPKDAARLFNELDMELLTGIAREISPRALAPVLAVMDPKRARALTEALRQG